MKKTLLLAGAAAAIFVLAAILTAPANPPESEYEIKSSELGGQTGAELMEYYNPEKYPLTPFEETTDYSRIKKGFTGKLEKIEKGTAFDYYIIITPQLLEPLAQELTAYKRAVKNDLGYKTATLICDNCSPQDIRASIQEGYQTGLKGALMIGDIPLAWYGSSQSNAYPTSYYYQDVDGEWLDGNQDGIFDRHQGDTGQEIFVGWLKSNDLTLTNETEVELLENYFEKNAAYRNGQLSFGEENIIFSDDVISSGLSLIQILPFANHVYSLFTTSASDYAPALHEGYKTVYVDAHSNPWVHGFTEADIVGQGCEWYNPSTSQGPNVKRCYNSFSNEDLAPAKLKVLIYLLNGCHVGRLTEQDNLANWYIFQKEGGLSATAATISISSGYYVSYAAKIAENKIFGEAFLETQNNKKESVLFGDPTLRANYPSVYESIIVDETNVAGEENGATVEITSKETSPVSATLEIYLNEESILNETLTIASPGETVEFSFTPAPGFNTLAACLTMNQKTWCSRTETMGVSPTLEINEDNYVLDCAAQGLNPRLGWDGIGIKVNAKNATIQNCELATFGVHLSITEGEGLTIKNNKFYNEKNYAYGYLTPYGPLTAPIKNAVISGNNITGLSVGLGFVEYYENTLISDNVFSGEMACYLLRLRGTLTNNLIIRDNKFCATVNENAFQLECDHELDEYAINEAESTGNQIDLVSPCTSGWPVYGEHYSNCIQQEQTP
ncbi:MAG: C25 family cysteine peptidase [Candidatus Micrarchaeia archaeon]